MPKVKKYASQHDGFNRAFRKSLADWSKGKGHGPSINQYIGMLLSLPGRDEASLGNNKTSKRWKEFVEQHEGSVSKWREFAYECRPSDGMDLKPLGITEGITEVECPFRLIVYVDEWKAAKALKSQPKAKKGLPESKSFLISEANSYLLRWQGQEPGFGQSGFG
jgi:hypothetical protein